MPAQITFYDEAGAPVYSAAIDEGQSAGGEIKDLPPEAMEVAVPTTARTWRLEWPEVLPVAPLRPDEPLPS